MVRERYPREGRGDPSRFLAANLDWMVHAPQPGATARRRRSVLVCIGRPSHFPCPRLAVFAQTFCPNQVGRRQRCATVYAHKPRASRQRWAESIFRANRPGRHVGPRIQTTLRHRPAATSALRSTTYLFAFAFRGDRTLTDYSRHRVAAPRSARAGWLAGCRFLEPGDSRHATEPHTSQIGDGRQIKGRGALHRMSHLSARDVFSANRPPL